MKSKQLFYNFNANLVNPLCSKVLPVFYPAKLSIFLYSVIPMYSVISMHSVISMFLCQTHCNQFLLVSKGEEEIWQSLLDVRQ
jgi:hypothetical protein